MPLISKKGFTLAISGILLPLPPISYQRSREKGKKINRAQSL
jgi:hypothetical protein